jgi:hypothetical protein
LQTIIATLVGDVFVNSVNFMFFKQSKMKLNLKKNKINSENRSIFQTITSHNLTAQHFALCFYVYIPATDKKQNMKQHEFLTLNNSIDLDIVDNLAKLSLTIV